MGFRIEIPKGNAPSTGIEKGARPSTHRGATSDASTFVFSLCKRPTEGPAMARQRACRSWCACAGPIQLRDVCAFPNSNKPCSEKKNKPATCDADPQGANRAHAEEESGARRRRPCAVTPRHQLPHYETASLQTDTGTHQASSPPSPSPTSSHHTVLTGVADARSARPTPSVIDVRRNYHSRYFSAPSPFQERRKKHRLSLLVK